MTPQDSATTNNEIEYPFDANTYEAKKARTKALSNKYNIKTYTSNNSKRFRMI